MKKLIVASTGITKGDISLKTLEKISKSDLILNYAIENYYLNTILPNKKIININDKISKIESDNDKFKYLCTLINKLFNTYFTLTLLTQGNPLFFNVFIQRLSKFFNKRIFLDIIPSISSFDYVINTIILKINPNLNAYVIISTPNYLICEEDIQLFNKDTIIMNFHSIKNKNFHNENKKIIDTISKMKNRHIYSIKIDTKKSREIIKKYLIPKELKKLIKDIDNETTLYLPAIK